MSISSMALRKQKFFGGLLLVWECSLRVDVRCLYSARDWKVIILARDYVEQCKKSCVGLFWRA